MKEDDIWAYAEEHSSPEPPLLSGLNRETNLTQVYPRMLAGHMQGTLLRMISHMLRPSRVLEIGTFTGYSALCFAEGLAPRTPGDNEGWGVHTIEVNPEQEKIIRKYFREAGAEERITLHIGDAMQIIPGLGLTWDLVYIDADKPNYLAYYEMVFPNVRTGGFILADNALWDGKVLLSHAKMDKDAQGISAYNDFVRSDNRVENLLVPFRDGLMIARKL
jgi:caffeoyl-CoA O-methyltransferase